MLKKNIKTEFPIEKIDFENKIQFPLIKNLSPKAQGLSITFPRDWRDFTV